MARNFRSNRRLALAGTALAAICLIANNAWAQGAWPTKPVKIVVPFAPGGTTDILARALAPELSKAFGQQFIVDNRPGAGNIPGTNAGAKSAADGYNIPSGLNPVTQLHQEEMVLPADIANPLRQNLAGGGGSGVQVNVQGASVGDFLLLHKSELVKALKSARRDLAF